MQSIEIEEQAEALAERESAINLYPLLGLALLVGTGPLLYGAFFFRWH